VAGQTWEAATNVVPVPTAGHGEANPRRFGGRQLSHDIARERVRGRW